MFPVLFPATYFALSLCSACHFALSEAWQHASCSPSALVPGLLMHAFEVSTRSSVICLVMSAFAQSLHLWKSVLHWLELCLHLKLDAQAIFAQQV